MSISLDFTLGTFTKLPVNFSQLIYPTRHTIPFIFHSYWQIYFLNSLLCISSLSSISMLLFSSSRWRNLLISVKYQQTARRHFNLNFDKLSYFGQKCKHWQGQEDISQESGVTIISSYQHRGFSTALSRHQVIRPHWPHYRSDSTVFLIRPCHWCACLFLCWCEAKASRITYMGVFYSYLSQHLINVNMLFTSLRGPQNILQNIFPYTIQYTYTHVTYARVSVRFG